MMKLADLPNEVITDLCQDDPWRLDIDPGFDAKHEFYLCWRHFVALPKEPPDLLRVYRSRSGRLPHIRGL